MQTEFSKLELPRTKPTLPLESCADFFDRDYTELLHDVQNSVVKFTWDIAIDQCEKGDAHDRTKRRCIRIYAASAWAFVYNQPMPRLSEDAVYDLVFPRRDIRSTELQRILACSPQHIAELEKFFIVTRPPLQADGPNSYTVYARQSIIAFLKSRRLS